VTDVLDAPGATPPAGPRRPRAALFAAVLLVVVIVAALVVWWAAHPASDVVPVAEAPAPLPPALAETMGEEGSLRIEVVSLDRLSPGTLELRLAVTHVGNGPTALDIAQRFSADDPDRGTLAEVYLADLGHQRKLFILRDAEGVPVGSRDDRPLGPGERREMWARYPAPADGDEALVVHVPHAEPMPNVPIGEPAPAAAEQTPEG